MVWKNLARTYLEYILKASRFKDKSVFYFKIYNYSPISQFSQDLLKSMLKIEEKDRVSWDSLFEIKNRYYM